MKYLSSHMAMFYRKKSWYLCFFLIKVWYLILLYTYKLNDFRTVCFQAIWYRKLDQRTEVFWIHITILYNEANLGYLLLRRRYVK